MTPSPIALAHLNYLRSCGGATYTVAVVRADDGACWCCASRTMSNSQRTPCYSIRSCSRTSRQRISATSRRSELLGAVPPRMPFTSSNVCRQTLTPVAEVHVGIGRRGGV
jgi:hypothetical protein